MREHNPALIRLVAARYNELQGLRTAGDAAFLCLAGASLWGANAVDVGYFSIGWPAGIVLSVAAGLSLFWWVRPGRRWLDRYYALRFGRVGGRTFFLSHALSCWLAASWMNMFVTLPLPATPAWVIALLVSPAAMVLVAVPGWTARRDFP